MAIFSDPTEGNCGWFCDATFVGDKPPYDDDGTNLPVDDNDFVYALISDGQGITPGSLKPGNGIEYEGFSGTYIAACYASATIHSEDPTVRSVDVGIYFGHSDPGNYDLYITKPTYFCKNILYTDGSWITNFQGTNPYDHSIYRFEYPELGQPSAGTIELSSFFGGRFQTDCAIVYGKWEFIKNRVKQYRTETAIYVAWIESGAEDPYPGYPWQVPDDFSPDSFYPVAVYSVYRPSDGYVSPTKQSSYEYCKWTCKGYTLPGKDKTQAWRIEDAFEFKVIDQYNNKATLNPCPGGSECENIRLAYIEPYFGGEECECPEGTIECKGRDGRKCCLKCCDLGAYVLNLFEGATQNANFNG